MLFVLGIGLRLLSVIFSLFPLKRRVAFLSRQGKVPSVDFCMLASCLQKNDPELSIVIRTSKPEQHGLGQLIRHMTSQLWYARTSKVVVLDGYNPTVCIPHKRKGVFVIQLWHAVGAIKKFGFQSIDTAAGRSSSYARLAHMHQNYDLIISAGPGGNAAYEEAFFYPKDYVVALGLPRIDRLLTGPSQAELKTKFVTDYPWLNNGNMNVLYAPTLRPSHTKDDWQETAINSLSTALVELPINLIVSKHPLTTLNNPDRLPANVFVLPGHSTEELLRLADVVITDYSAIALEAGLIGSTVLFFMPDYEEYSYSPGLNIDPLHNPQLFGAIHAEDIATALHNREYLARVQKNYSAFTQSYFEGITPGSTERIAQLIYEHIDETYKSKTR